MYCKSEIRFDIYEAEYVKFLIRGLKFVFSHFFHCRLNFCFVTEITWKTGMPAESEESEGLFPTIQKDEKIAFF